VVAAEFALSFRPVTVGCLLEVLCRICNISVSVIAAVLAVREQSNPKATRSGSEVVVSGDVSEVAISDPGKPRSRQLLPAANGLRF
jgi:hypothetical protein